MVLRQRARGQSCSAESSSARSFDFNVVGVPAVTVNGEVVSSTAIRRAVADGDLIKATQMLGREYTILGTVKAGEKLGRKLGISHGEPERAQRTISSQRSLRRRRRGSRALLYRGVANLGYRPTVSAGKPERLLELHLFDLNKDIYGEEVEVRFLRYLRPEQKFENVEALAAQIARDVARGAS